MILGIFGPGEVARVAFFVQGLSIRDAVSFGWILRIKRLTGVVGYTTAGVGRGVARLYTAMSVVVFETKVACGTSRFVGFTLKTLEGSTDTFFGLVCIRCNAFLFGRARACSCGGVTRCETGVAPAAQARLASPIGGVRGASEFTELTFLSRGRTRIATCPLLAWGVRCAVIPLRLGRIFTLARLTFLSGFLSLINASSCRRIGEADALTEKAARAVGRGWVTRLFAIGDVVGLVEQEAQVARGAKLVCGVAHISCVLCCGHTLVVDTNET